MILRVTGKNIYNFIYKLNKLKVDLFNINYQGINEIEIEINRSDYEKIIENKTIYEIEIKEYKGLVKTKKTLFNYKYILIFCFISLSIIYFLSNLIFRVDIITNDLKMKNKINEFLKDNGISLYHLKKSYKELQAIKTKILQKYKDEIDWIEIENEGSRYIVKFEPRLNTNLIKDTKYRSIVAKKDSIIYSLDVSSGQIIKNRFEYVKKGDVIVSGYIYLNEKIKNTVSATGKVYGEVWYKVTVKQTLKQEIKKKSGKSRYTFVFKFLNKEFQLFNFNKYKNYNKKDNNILKNSLLPISLILQKQEEIKVNIENKTYEEALENAIKEGKKKLEKKFVENEFIKDYKILSEDKNDKELTVEIFFSAIEDISEYQEIEEYKEDPLEDE